MSTYSDLERTIANYVLNKIKLMLDQYFGNDIYTSELIDRNIALYEKKTYITLLCLHAYRFLLNRERELIDWGKVPLNEDEFKNIYQLIHSKKRDWINTYDLWQKEHSSWSVSDITGKKSKVIKYINMSEVNWAKLRDIIEKESNKIKVKYSKTIIYTFLTKTEESQYKEKYPEQSFISKEAVTEELTNNVLETINSSFTYDIPFFNAYINRIVDTLENESEDIVKNNGVVSAQTKTIRSKHQQFIDYITQQLFGESSYLFGQTGINSQNVYKAIQKDEEPRLTDFGNFVYAKAVSEAYRGGNSSYGNSDNYKYTESDIDKVIEKNKKYVREIVIPNYEEILRKNDKASDTTGDMETGEAFGLKIPKEDEIKNVYNEVKKELEDNPIKKAELTPQDEEDIANYIKDLTNKTTDIPEEFTNPTTEANTNKVINELRKREKKDPFVNENIQTSSTRSKLREWKAIDFTRNHIDQYHGSGDVASRFTPTYKTFSGHDMVVTVELPISKNYHITKVIGAFQTVTYSIHNGKSPIRVLGDMNVRRYVQGPRTIAGTLILTVFDRHWIKELLGSYKKIKGETERYFLADELPSFNMTISCTNEYGHDAKLAIYGITLVDEGQVMSINDVYTENTYTFFATSVEYLDRVEETIAINGKVSLLSNLPTKTESSKTSEETENGGDNLEESDEEYDNNTDAFTSKYIYSNQDAINKLSSIDKTGKSDFNNTINNLAEKKKSNSITDEKFTNEVAKAIKEESNRESKLWEKEITNPAIEDIKNSSDSDDVKKWQRNKVRDNANQVKSAIESNNTKIANDIINNKLKEEE